MIKKLILPFILCLLVSNTVFSNEDRSAKQAQLDAACEAARELKLAPLRQQHIDECVGQQKKDRAECERFYQNYGGRQGNKAPLFYDLPECVKAFEYQKSYRKGK